MKNKREHRHEVIRQLISSGRIGSQDELLTLLRDKGVAMTQATLSRDLYMMKVIKVPDGKNGHVYLNPEGFMPEKREEQLRVNYLADGFRDLQYSGNLAVIRTLPGYASSIAAVIDAAQQEMLMGTIAGDDTILLIMKEGFTREELVRELIAIMPYLKTKLENKKLK